MIVDAGQPARSVLERVVRLNKCPAGQLILIRVAAHAVNSLPRDGQLLVAT